MIFLPQFQINWECGCVVYTPSLLLLLTFFIVNDGDVINCCNPQKMRCIVCHPTTLLFDGGKHKGLLNYNKNCGMSSLKKTCH